MLAGNHVLVCAGARCCLAAGLHILRALPRHWVPCHVASQRHGPAAVRLHSVNTALHTQLWRTAVVRLILLGQRANNKGGCRAASDLERGGWPQASGDHAGKGGGVQRPLNAIPNPGLRRRCGWRISVGDLCWWGCRSVALSGASPLYLCTNIGIHVCNCVQGLHSHVTAYRHHIDTACS